jgi:hypothetical protein
MSLLFCWQPYFFLSFDVRPCKFRLHLMENFTNTDYQYHISYEVSGFRDGNCLLGCEAMQSGECKHFDRTVCIQLQNISSCSALRIKICSSETSARITHDYVVSLYYIALFVTNRNGPTLRKKFTWYIICIFFLYNFCLQHFSFYEEFGNVL